jgi:hypothetical protein
MPERWERELRNLGAIDAPSSVDERLRQGPRGEDGGPSTRHRIVVVVVAFAVFAAAGAFAFAAFGGGVTRPPGPGGSSSPGASLTPLVRGAVPDLLVRCGRSSEQTKVTTPIVSAHRDGLHLAFQHPGNFRSFQIMSGEGSTFSGVGGSIPKADAGHSVPVPPGAYRVTCGTNPSRSAIQHAPTFTLADPDAHWESATIGCANVTSTIVTIREVYPSRAGKEMWKDVTGILKSDVVAPVGYPDASVWKTATYWAVVKRDGQSIASLRLEPAGHIFILTVEACPGSGIQLAPGAGDSTTGDACSEPALRPSYLPWVIEGQVPSPDVNPIYKHVDWSAPDISDWAGSYVGLRLLDHPVATKGDPAPSLPDGTEGVVSQSGDQVIMSWQPSKAYCGSLALYVHVTHQTAQSAMNIATEIARSLTP